MQTPERLALKRDCQNCEHQKSDVNVDYYCAHPDYADLLDVRAWQVVVLKAGLMTAWGIPLAGAVARCGPCPGFEDDGLGVDQTP